MNAAKLTLGPGIPGGPGAPCGPGGPCAQKIKPVMIRLHCPPRLTSSGQLASILLPTQSNWLLQHAAWFVLQVYRGASKRVLAIGGDAGAHGWSPLCPQRSSPQHAFLFEGLPLSLKRSLSLFLAFKTGQICNMKWLGPAGSAGPVTSLTIWICCLLSQKSPSHTVEDGSTLSQALTSS